MCCVSCTGDLLVDRRLPRVVRPGPPSARSSRRPEVEHGGPTPSAGKGLADRRRQGRGRGASADGGLDGCGSVADVRALTAFGRSATTELGPLDPMPDEQRRL